MTKKIISSVLALLLGGSTLLSMAACGQTEDDPKDTSAVTTGEAETEKNLAYDTVEKKKYDRDFVLYLREDWPEQFVADALTGDLLNDAIYERNITVSNDFDIEFQYYTNTYERINNDLRLQVTGGLDEFDVYESHLSSFSACVQSGYCYNMSNVETLDLSAAWWDQACVENLSVNDKTYMITGDIDPKTLLTASCIVVNKKLLQDQKMNVNDLYEQAHNGGWTLDSLYEYNKDVTLDMNGDDTIDFKNDRYGFVGWSLDASFSLFYGAGGRFVTVTDGTPELSYSMENLTNIYEKIYKVVVAQQGYYATDIAESAEPYNVFIAGRALFCDANLRKLDSMGITEMADPYGILPVPKYDVNQPEYLSFINGSVPMVMVANNNGDIDFVGHILEAMGAFNYDKVTPLLFEVSTKLQAAQDPDSSAMVDYIIRNHIYDLAYFGDLGLPSLIQSALSSKKNSLASDIQSASKVAEKKLKNLITAYNRHK